MMPAHPEMPMGIDVIQRYLPHRSPFLLIDRVLSVEPPPGSAPADRIGDLAFFEKAERLGTRVRARKAVSFNEPYFPGHFPGQPVLPGVLLLEIFAQTTSFSALPWVGIGTDLSKRFRCYLTGVDEARFRRMIVPGDMLEIESVVTRARGGLWGFDVHGTVDGKRVAEAKILAQLAFAPAEAGASS